MPNKMQKAPQKPRDMKKSFGRLFKYLKIYMPLIISNICNKRYGRKGAMDKFILMARDFNSLPKQRKTNLKVSKKYRRLEQHN